jgi:hypothetical protein
MIKKIRKAKKNTKKMPNPAMMAAIEPASEFSIDYNFNTI